MTSMRARIKRRQRIRRLTIIVTIAVIFVSLIIGFYFALNNSSPYRKFVGQSASASVLGAVSGVSDSTLNAVGVPSNVHPPNSISGSALTSGGKPLILYIGGDYCPFCAVERWSLIMALDRFGNFSGLQYMLSSSSDVNPNSPTFTFSAASYTSKYVSFVGWEEWGQDPAVIVNPLTSGQCGTLNCTSLVSQYDVCPGTSGSGGGVPFIDIANTYAVNCGAQSTLVLSGKNWTGSNGVAPLLNDPNDNNARLIDGAANTLITAICAVDGHQPSSVCSQSYASVTLSYTPSAPSSPGIQLVAAPAYRPSVPRL